MGYKAILRTRTWQEVGRTLVDGLPQDTTSIVHPISDGAMLVSVLAEHFGLALTRAEADVIFGRLVAE